MVAITKEIPSGTTRYSALSSSDTTTVVQIIQYLKPLSYVALGFVFCSAILNGHSQENSIRGSSLTSVHMKNVSDIPYIHVDINFPDQNAGKMMEGNLPTVDVTRPGLGESTNVPVNVNANMNESSPEDYQENVADGLMAAVDSSMAEGGGQMQEFGATPAQQDANRNPIVTSPDPMAAAPMGQYSNGNSLMTMNGATEITSTQQDATSMANQIRAGNVLTDENGNAVMSNQVSMGVAPMQTSSQVPMSTTGATTMQDPNQMQSPPMMMQGQDMQPGTTTPAMQDPSQMQSPPMMMQGQEMQPVTTTPAMQDPSQVQPSTMMQQGQMQTGTTTPLQDPNQVQPSTMMQNNQMTAGVAPMQPAGGQMQQMPMMSTSTGQMQQTSTPMMQGAAGIDVLISQDQTAPLPIIYTFYERIDPEERSTGMDDKSDNELLSVWEERWTAAGWEPRVLTLEDAKKHPQFEEYSAKLKHIPMGGKSGKGNNRVYNELCFLRWLAMSAVGGGTMSDYDLFPLGPYGTGTNTPPAPEIPDGGSFTVYSIAKDSKGAGIPCLMSGSSNEWTRMAFSIVENGVQQKDSEETHWTDMFALMDLRFDNVYKVQDEVIDGQYVLNGREWELNDCQITTGKRAVHFSHAAIEEGDAAYIKGGKISVSDRPGVIAHWLDVWNNVCLALN